MTYLSHNLNAILYFFLASKDKNLKTSLVKQTVYSVQVAIQTNGGGFESPHSWALLDTIISISNSYRQLLANVQRIQRRLQYSLNFVREIERLPMHRSRRDLFLPSRYL